MIRDGLLRVSGISLLVAILTGAGCPPKADENLPLSSLPPGWQCLLIPSSFDAPGSIFSIDSQGRKFHVADLSNDPHVVVHKGAAAFPKISEKRDLSANIVLSLLEKAIPGATANLSVSASSTTNNVVEYGDLVYEITYESSSNFVRVWFNNNIVPKDETRYFFVREAYVAGTINYDVSTDVVQSLGGEAKFKSLIEAKGDLIKHENKTGYQLQQKLSPPLRACILASEFGPILGAVGSPGLLNHWYIDVSENADIPPIREY